MHLQNIYDTDELKKEATNEKISVVRREGNRDVNRTLQFYNLDAIISVGYRVSVSAEEAKEHAETEFEKYRIVQDRLFRSDFDKYLGELPFDGE